MGSRDKQLAVVERHAEAVLRAFGLFDMWPNASVLELARACGVEVLHYDAHPTLLGSSRSLLVEYCGHRTIALARELDPAVGRWEVLLRVSQHLLCLLERRGREPKAVAPHPEPRLAALGLCVVPDQAGAISLALALALPTEMLCEELETRLTGNAGDIAQITNVLAATAEDFAVPLPVLRKKLELLRGTSWLQDGVPLAAKLSAGEAAAARA